jgi:hypothetical protein
MSPDETKQEGKEGGEPRKPEDRHAEGHDEHGEPDHGHEDHEYKIQIDRVHYTVTKKEMTGAELRHVPPTPIGADRDLFEVVPGGTDRKIGDNEEVEIRDGKRFFTAPAQINPGNHTP